MKQLLSYNSIADFPKTGNYNVIYRDNASMHMYRWDGEYIDLSEGCTVDEHVFETQFETQFE